MFFISQQRERERECERKDEARLIKGEQAKKPCPFHLQIERETEQ